MTRFTAFFDQLSRVLIFNLAIYSSFPRKPVLYALVPLRAGIAVAVVVLERKICWMNVRRRLVCVERRKRRRVRWRYVEMQLERDNLLLGARKSGGRRVCVRERV